MMTIMSKNKIKVENINTTQLTTIAKQDKIIDMIICGAGKNECISYIMDNWNYSAISARTFYRQCFVMIYTMANKTKDDIKDLSLARLEGIYDEIEEGGQIKDRLKTIDLINKTAGVYEDTRKIEISNAEDEEFRFEIGSKDKGE